MSSKRSSLIAQDLTKLKSGNWLLLDKWPTDSRTGFFWRKGLTDQGAQACMYKRSSVRRILNLPKKTKVGNMIVSGLLSDLLRVSYEVKANQIKIQGKDNLIKLFPPYDVDRSELKSLALVSFLPKVFFWHLLQLIDNLKKEM